MIEYNTLCDRLISREKKPALVGLGFMGMLIEVKSLCRTDELRASGMRFRRL